MYNNLFLELFIHKKDYNSKFWKLYKYIPIKDILIATYILWILLFDFLFDLPIGPNALGVCIKYLEKPYIHVNNNCFLVLILLSWPHNYTGFNNMNSAKSIKQNKNTQTHNIVIICSGYRTPKNTLDRSQKPQLTTIQNSKISPHVMIEFWHRLLTSWRPTPD